ncbi:MAG: FtsX-like permease family protein [Phycisphaerae bacterium]|nr:FtsX-like permease family protein [Phycisphaerae bacterium]
MASLLPSWSFARQALAGRRGRTALLVTAVALSAALVTAVSCVIATVQSNVDMRLRKLVGDADARLVQRYGEDFSDDAIATVRALPGVSYAVGRLEGSLTLVRADGAKDEFGRPKRATVHARGDDLVEDVRIREVTMLAGRRPERDDEIIVDPLAAQLLDAGPGTQVVVQRFGEPVPLTITGIYERPVLGALQRPLAQVARRTLSMAQGQDPEVSRIVIKLEPGLKAQAWIDEHKGAFEDPLLLEPAELATAGFTRQMEAADLGLLIATMIAFMACAFIVATGMTVAVSEQVREMAIARCIGAERRDLFLGQLMVGAVVGGLGGLFGAPLGIAMAWGLAESYKDLVPAGISIAPLGVMLSLGGALMSGLLGAMWPATAASRVSPLMALTVRARTVSGSLPWSLGALGAACVGVQLLLLMIPEVEPRFWAWALVGLPLVHLGWFLLSVPILAAMAPWTGALIEHALRVPRGLLTGSLRASPVRFGLTAGALMMGVSLMVGTRSDSEALVHNLSERVRFADAFVFKTAGFTPEEQERVRAIPGVINAVSVGYMPIRVRGFERRDGTAGETVLGLKAISPPNVVCIGFQPEAFFRQNRIEWIRGTAEAALPALQDGSGVLVAEEFLTARGLDVGDRVFLGSRGEKRGFTIVGVVGSAGLDLATQFFGIRSMYMEHAVSCIFMDFDVVARDFGNREAVIMQFSVPPDLDDAGEKAMAAQLEDQIPGASFASGRSIRRAVLEIGDVMLVLSAAIALGAMILACFAVGNVVVAGIAARRQEFGVLRAVGATPSLLLRVIVGEVLAIALAAIVSGFGLGIHLAWMATRLYRELAGLELKVTLTPLPLAIGCVVLMVLTALAAIPAGVHLMRRPARDLLAAARGA